MKKSMGFFGVVKSTSAVIQKNFKILFRSWSSSFIIILGPLLVMILVGMAFNNSTMFNIQLATYSGEYSNLSNQIIQQLEEKDYIVTKVSSKADCLNGVKSGQFNLCLVLSDNMIISNDVNNKITFYVDPSRINIVYIIMADINKEILKTSSDLSLELTETVINKLLYSKEELGSKIDIFSSLDSNNNNMLQNIVNIKNSTDNIDLQLDYNLFEISDLREEAGRINATYNMSSADFGSLNSKISTVDSQILAALQKVDSAELKIGEISSNLGGIPIVIQDNINQTNTIKLGFDNVINSINSIAITNPETIVSPIKTKVEQVIAQKTHLGKFLPTFLVLIIMFVCVLLSSSLIINERTSTAYFRNTITATPDFVFLLGAYLTSFVIVVLQLLIIALALDFVIDYGINFWINAIIPLLLIASMFILIGITIGYLAHSQETSNIISFFIIVGSLFFSNTILPIETIPLYLKQIVLYNPFVVGELILKKLIVFSFALKSVLDSIIRLLVYNLVFLVLGYLALKHSKNKAKK